MSGFEKNQSLPPLGSGELFSGILHYFHNHLQQQAVDHLDVRSKN